MSGVVKQIGSEVSGVNVGDRVIAFSTWGGFAEELVIAEELLI